MGLPGETHETIKNTIRFAKELDVETIQVSVAHAYPGTELYDYAVKNGFMVGGQQDGRRRRPSAWPKSSIPGFPPTTFWRRCTASTTNIISGPRPRSAFCARRYSTGMERKRLYKEAKTFLKLRAARNKMVKKHAEAAASAAPAKA